MGNFLSKQLHHVSNLRRSRRAEMRQVFLAYKDGLKFRRESAMWSTEQKNDYTLQRLRFAVRRAKNETVFYSDLFKEIGFEPEDDFTFEDYAKLPILEKNDIAAAGRNLVSHKISLENLKRDATGGSTGIPTEFWLGPEEMGWRESGIEYFLNEIGIAPGARTAYLWGHHLDPQAKDNIKDQLKAYLTNIRWFDCFRLSAEVFEKYNREFEKWKPDCVMAYASALGYLGQFLVEKGIEPRDYPVKCFVTGAEKLYPHHRKIVEQIFQKPVHERYGGRDSGGIGIQLEPQKNLDFALDWSLLMVEPENTDPAAPILVTKLRADGMPMLRYRIGDLGAFAQNSSPGYPTFILHEVVGRTLDRLWLPDDNWINGLEFPHLLKDFAIQEFMLVQAENYDVELKIVTKKGFDEQQVKAIRETLIPNLKGVKLTISEVAEIPRTTANKWRPVSSAVKR